MSSFVDRNIGVVVRLRPVQGEGVRDGVGSSFSVRPTSITVHSRKPPPGSVLNNAAESHTLEGITVLTPSSTQEECYRVVASDIVEGAVAGGISGCILAYGQTGSGKTHSMLGADMGGQYSARGIMPRALSHAFACAEKALQERGLDPSARHTFRLSYVEVIENRVVDLLAKASAPPSGEGGGETTGEGGAGDNITTPLSAAAERVAVKGGGEYHTNLSVQEDKAGRTYIPGLHMPRVKSEEEALHLLLEGNAQRALSQHALNKASTRAHAVLTLYIEQQIPETPAPPQATAAAAASYQQHPPVPQPLSASAPPPNSPTRAPPIRTLTVSSKLHLVDLAGSERVRKTESEGKTLREANFINKSLSALEAVVVALSDAAAVAAAAAASATAGGGSTSPGGSGASATAHSLTTTTTTTDLHGGEHIPYRSSRLTHLLKGALGGGPGTTRLLSTLWPGDEHAEECVATLRFSGRMMNLKTRAVREIVKGSGGGGGGGGGKGGGGWDAVEREAILTAHAAEVALLRRELALHDVLAGRGRGVTTSHAPLSQGEQGVIADLVDAFIEAGEGSPGLVAGGKLSTIRHIDAALNLMRREVWRARERLEDGRGRSGSGGGGGGDAMRDTPAAAVAQRSGSGSGSGDGGKAPGIAVSPPPPLHSQPQPYQQQYPLDNGGNSGGGRVAGGKVVSSPSPKPTTPPSSPKHQGGFYPPPPPQAFQPQQQQQQQQYAAGAGPPPPPPPSHFIDTSATSAGKESMSHAERDLEAWRETAPEYKKFVESRQAVRDAKGKYTAAATAVNEAKREIDALMAAGIPKLMALPPPLPPPPPPPPPRPPRVRKTPPPPPPAVVANAPAQKPPSSRPPTAAAAASAATSESATKPPSSRPTTATTAAAAAAAAASKPSSRPPTANAAGAAGVAASKPSSRPPTANAAGAGAGAASKPPSRPSTASAAPAPTSTPTAEGGEGEKVALPVPEGEASAAVPEDSQAPPATAPEGESAPGVPPSVEGEKKEGEVEGAAVATGVEEGGAGAAVVAPEGGVEGVEALAVGLAPSLEEATPAAAPSGDAPAAETTGGAAGDADAAATLPHTEEHKGDGSGGGVQEKEEEGAAAKAAAVQAREAEEAELAAKAAAVAAAAFAEAEAAEDAAEAAAVAAEAAEAEAAAAAYAAAQAAAAREVEAVTLHNAGVEEATRKLVEAKARYKAKYEEALALKDEVEYLTEVTEALGKASAAAFHRHLEEEKAMGRGRGGVVGVGGP